MLLGLLEDVSGAKLGPISSSIGPLSLRDLENVVALNRGVTAWLALMNAVSGHHELSGASNVTVKELPSESGRIDWSKCAEHVHWALKSAMRAEPNDPTDLDSVPQSQTSEKTMVW